MAPHTAVWASALRKRYLWEASTSATPTVLPADLIRGPLPTHAVLREALG
ncbi:hypothetical protein ABIB57_002146 [Devosia sp. UYZn731]